MNIYAPHVFSTPASHKRAMDPVELSYKAAMWLLAMKPIFTTRAASALNHLGDITFII